MLNQLTLVGEVESIIDDGVIQLSVDGTFVTILMPEDIFLNLPDNFDQLGMVMGVHAHLENLPDGSLMVVADKVMCMLKGAAEDEGRYS